MALITIIQRFDAIFLSHSCNWFFVPRGPTVTIKFPSHPHIPQPILAHFFTVDHGSSHKFPWMHIQRLDGAFSRHFSIIAVHRDTIDWIGKIVMLVVSTCPSWSLVEAQPLTQMWDVNGRSRRKTNEVNINRFSWYSSWRFLFPETVLLGSSRQGAAFIYFRTWLMFQR